MFINRVMDEDLAGVCVCVCVCVYEGSTIQPLKKEILQFIESWIDLEGGMLNEISMLN